MDMVFSQMGIPHAGIRRLKNSPLRHFGEQTDMQVK
jgi:hypothetical protein